MLQHKVVIITGASSGIGEATAYAFAKQGAKLMLAARNVKELQRVQHNCVSQFQAEVQTMPCDVSQLKDCEQLIQQTLQHFNAIDVLINNAGISMRALFNQCEVEVIEQLMQVNFWGTVYCTKFALPHLLKNKGSVIAVSSVAGMVGLPARTGYSASKFAMEGFMQSLRTENLKNNLHVGVIYPGYTASNIRNKALNSEGKVQQESPLNESKLMPAAEVAEAIVQMVLKRQRSKVLTLIGRVSKWINILFPSLSDRMVYNFVAKEKDSPFK